MQTVGKNCPYATRVWGLRWKSSRLGLELSGRMPAHTSDNWCWFSLGDLAGWGAGTPTGSLSRWPGFLKHSGYVLRATTMQVRERKGWGAARERERMKGRNQTVRTSLRSHIVSPPPPVMKVCPGSSRQERQWRIVTRTCCCLFSKSCLILFNPVDCSSSVRGILQARILQWIAMPSSRGSFQPRDWTHIFMSPALGSGGSLPLVPPGKPNESMWEIRSAIARLSTFAGNWCLIPVGTSGR